MFTLLGIVLLVTGASLTFAVDRQDEGVDVQLVGWILMAGGALALLIATIRAAGLMAPSNGPGDVGDPRVDDLHGPDRHGPDRTDEGRRAA